jgi:hypothetical protein
METEVSIPMPESGEAGDHAAPAGVDGAVRRGAEGLK